MNRNKSQPNRINPPKKTKQNTNKRERWKDYLFWRKSIILVAKLDKIECPPVSDD